MSKKKDKTTIIFLNNHQNYNKPIQVPSSYVEHWKKFAIGFSGLLILLLGIIIYLADSRIKIVNANQQAISQLLLKLNEHEAQKAQLDTSAIKKHYLSIDEKLRTINKYLKARGLKPISKNTGGDANSELGSTEEIGSFYEGYLNKMMKLVGFTPMGYPHRGAITSMYGHRENPFTGENIESHKGLDIKGSLGAPVKSTANGYVTFANRRGGYGNCVVINHGNGFETYYGHLSKIRVKQGQKVMAGDVIGNIGSTGRSTGPHLHYEVHRDGKIVNPKSYLTLE